MPQKILVVDDDRAIRLMARKALMDAGFDVQEAVDGQDAIERLREEACDLLVLDVIMPRMDGWEVLRHIRSDDSTADLPVVMLTVLKEDRHIAQGWHLGADYYMTKPFSPADLVDVVRRLVISEGPP
ncbi:MAG: PleD family two-component system response regulator [Armatimonadota bacterium]